MQSDEEKAREILANLEVKDESEDDESDSGRVDVKEVKIIFNILKMFQIGWAIWNLSLLRLN